MSEDLMREITQRLVETFQPEQVILFGSHAWGSPTPDSDIDLMVIVSDSDHTPYQQAVIGHRCLSGLGIAKDIVVRTRAEFDFWQTARASLEYKVAHQGKVLYDRRQNSTGTELVNQGAA
jgi:predicted nucleotidyltransferase